MFLKVDMMIAHVLHGKDPLRSSNRGFWLIPDATLTRENV